LELRLLGEALDATGEQGRALVFCGEPGIGKSVLLDAAADRAVGGHVSTIGVEAESSLPYSGLHRLLHPLLEGVDELPPPQRSALLIAFGLAEGSSGDGFLVGLATLGLLSAAASRAPLLVTVDDLHWLDAASRDVVGFVGRRLDADPIVLVAAVRSGYESEVRALGLPIHTVGSLQSDEAAALLDMRAPGLEPIVRRRLLVEAAGNPLALAELPLTAKETPSSPATGVTPISARLEQAFADRISDAAPQTIALLLTFAADVTSTLAEVLEAAATLADRPLTIGDLQPAFDAGLVSIDGVGLRFRHPLVRSAVYQSAPLEQRYAAHAALAKVVADQPDRRAQHRAAAAVGPDEGVAQDLEDMGRRALRRGATLQASDALALAADLSESPTAQVRRLFAAAEPAYEAGRRDTVESLVRRVRAHPLGERDTARAEWLSEIFNHGAGPGQGERPRVLRLLGAAALAVDSDDTELALGLLTSAALRSWWGGASPEVRDEVLAAVERVEVAPTDPRRVSAMAIADPIGRAAEVLRLVEDASSAEARDPRDTYLLGIASHCVAAEDISLRLFAAASEGLREQGRLALLAQLQVMRAIDAISVGEWSVAATAADEAAQLCRETDQLIWLSSATAARGAVAGMRGDQEAADALSAEAVTISDAAASNAVRCWLQTARAIVAMSAARYDEAYAELLKTFDPQSNVYNLRDQYRGVGLFADAAVCLGNVEEARRIVDELDRRAAAAPTIGFHVGILYARPLLAPDRDADAMFRAALAAPWSSRPFEHARLHLAYGRWLRRQRRVVESREPLRVARDDFDALGALPWGERAREELRAAGEISNARQPRAWDHLSPQELQIGHLAASGLSNREIGQRLYLSPRTVASHLYRAFPKLGITSRSQLSATLPPQA
jgi:DNA-binding CsgD family transcriptional regulator